MYNYSKLLGRMKEKGFSQEALANRIGLTSGALNRKLKNNSDFKQSEIEAILSCLDKTVDDLVSYFFVH